MSDETRRSVRLERVQRGSYRVENARGGTLTTGEGDDEHFSPVELLLAAIGACTASDVDYITSRRAEPTHFEITVDGDKVSGETGNVMENLRVTFAVAFPPGDDGDTAREFLPRAVKRSHDRLCTVSRTIERGTPIATVVE